MTDYELIVPGPTADYTESRFFVLTQLIHINPRTLITEFDAYCGGGLSSNLDQTVGYLVLGFLCLLRYFNLWIPGRDFQTEATEFVFSIPDHTGPEAPQPILHLVPGLFPRGKEAEA